MLGIMLQFQWYCNMILEKEKPANSLEQRAFLVAGGLGFEPRLAESESAVLPLDDPPPIHMWISSGGPARGRKPGLDCPSSRSFARLARRRERFGHLEAR